MEVRLGAPYAEEFGFKSEGTGYVLNGSKPGCDTPSSLICGVLLKSNPEGLLSL